MTERGGYPLPYFSNSSEALPCAYFPDPDTAICTKVVNSDDLKKPNQLVYDTPGPDGERMRVSVCRPAVGVNRWFATSTPQAQQAECDCYTPMTPETIPQQ